MQRNRHTLFSLLAVWLFLAAMQNSGKADSLSGVIADDISKTPVQGAIIWLENTNFSDTTDASGAYFIDGVSSGIYTVIIQASDYQQKVFPDFQISGTVPVELSAFSAMQTSGGVLLAWETRSETNNLHFEIYRGPGRGDLEKIGQVPGAGSTVREKNYSFLDSEIQMGMTYTYKIKQVDTDGASTWTGQVDVAIAGPQAYTLKQNFPNPFNPSTQISYELPSQDQVTLEIFDLTGRKVKTLVNEEQNAGAYSLVWNADDDKGRKAPTGVYFYRLTAGSFSQIRRMALVE